MISRELLNGASLLPEQIRNWVLDQNEARGEIEEIRLRIGKPVTAISRGNVLCTYNGAYFSKEQMNVFIEKATHYSLHSAADSIRMGFITSFGGIRIGICGTAVINKGEISAIREITSANMRIPHENHGMASGIADRLLKDGRIMNTLIVSPPGYGKTTLLRELVRVISSKGYNCGVSDERGEIAAIHGGVCGFDVGCNTDVMNQAPKAKAAMMLLRTMKPDLIAMDEISEPQDMEAVRAVNGCGVSILATIHGCNIMDIMRRTSVCGLMEEKVFETALIISLVNGGRIITMEKLPA